jgi:pseudaminic acid synthase
MKVPAYKIASFEITDIPLIEYVAKKGKPVIISTGIATIDDIQLAVDSCRNAGNSQISLLKCTSAYPAPVEEANLLTIPDLAAKFNIVPGLSDHTESDIVPVVAVSLGARIIEKHFILDRKIGGPDASFSLESAEFRKMVNNIREAELSLGKVTYELSEKILKNRHFSRSLYCVKDVKAGEEITSENVRSIRPGNGIHPRYYFSLLGKKAVVDIERGTPLSEEMISK